MDNIVKFIYCLNLGTEVGYDKIKYYTKYTDLDDKRVLKLNDNFQVIDSKASQILLKYLYNKDEYKDRGMKVFKKIGERIKAQ